MADELRDACRFCGKAIRYVRWLDPNTAPAEVPREPDRWDPEIIKIQHAYQRVHWEHVDSCLLRCEPDNEDNRHTALPFSYCAERKTDGAMCMRKAQDEYRAEGIIACGTHARNVREEMRIHKQNEEYQQRRQDEREMAKMEAEAYVQARLSLMALPGAEEYLWDLKGYKPLSYSEATRVDKTIKVDVLDLWKFVSGNKEEAIVDDGEEYEEWELVDDEEA